MHNPFSRLARLDMRTQVPTEIPTEYTVANTLMLDDASREIRFYKNLNRIATHIYATKNISRVIEALSTKLCDLFHAQRFTYYGVDLEQSILVSEVKTGLNASGDIKLPISSRSVAGFVAFSREVVNISDVYDDVQLAAIHPDLQFLKTVDERSGFKTREVLCAPVVDGQKLLGVMQFINHQEGHAFDGLAQEGVQKLAKVLANALLLQGLSEGVKIQVNKYKFLVMDDVIDGEDFLAGLAMARSKVCHVEEALMSHCDLKPTQIGRAVAKFYRLPYEGFDAKRLRLERLHGLLKSEYVLEQGWIPLDESEKSLRVMCLDPEHVRHLRVVRQLFKHHAQIDYCVTTQVEFIATVEQLLVIPEDDFMVIEAVLNDDKSLGALNEDSPEYLEKEASNNELVKFVNKLIVDAYAQGASDIHIEPLPGKARTGVRFRIDGTLSHYVEVPAFYRSALVARIKVMCDLDISERRKPQDGKIQFKKYGPLDIELRVATIPTTGKLEDVVMRILASGSPTPIEELNLLAHNFEKLSKVIANPHGLFYVCGPTGSGKNTTLHSILKHLNTPNIKIWTAEDPVEITQKGLRQVQVNKKAGIDFALIMRALLRSDPDVIMVGESRDKETVSMGIEASLTGHLVFSTLHTNSAAESITRLIGMGMDPFNFSDALLGILAQRLTKRLCDCKEAYEPTEEELTMFVEEYSQDLSALPFWQENFLAKRSELLKSWQQQYGSKEGKFNFYRSAGCDHCNNTGYKGRLAIHEILINNAHIRALIQSRSTVAQVFEAALKSGMTTLKMDGMQKVLQGLTDLKMIRQVCIS